MLVQFEMPQHRRHSGRGLFYGRARSNWLNAVAVHRCGSLSGKSLYTNKVRSPPFLVFVVQLLICFLLPGMGGNFHSTCFQAVPSRQLSFSENVFPVNQFA